MDLGPHRRKGQFYSFCVKICWDSAPVVAAVPLLKNVSLDSVDVENLIGVVAFFFFRFNTKVLLDPGRNKRDEVCRMFSLPPRGSGQFIGHVADEPMTWTSA